MNIAPSTFDADVIPLIEILTDNFGDKTIGFKLGGFNPGPNVLVAGHAPVADRIYDRLIALPTINWMHGSMTLIILNEIEGQGIRSHFGAQIDPRPDELHFLPYHLNATLHHEAITQGYWSTLRLCARLGMISGRGIPNPAANQTGAPDA